MPRNPLSTRLATHLVCAVALTLTALMTQLSGTATAAGPPLVVDHSSVPAVLDGQLTDPVSTTFTASTGEGSAALSAIASGLPDGVTLAAKNTTSASDASWTISGTPTAAVDSPVHVTVSDGVGSSAFDLTLSVEPEDATVVYTGQTNVVGPDWEAEEVPVTLSAQVTQDPDGNLGPINTATVDFTNTLLDEDMCVDVPVTTAGTGPGTATCTFAADLSEFDRIDYTIEETVFGGFDGVSASETTLTVSLPDEPEDVPPDTKITSGPSGWLLDDTATFRFVSTQPDDDTDFFCRFDNAKQACQGSPVTIDDLSERTHEFTVAAEDEDGDRDETPATRSFAVPLDDAGLTPTGTWKRKRNAPSYLGTYSQAKKKNVSLSYKVNDVRELALLVRTGKKYGSVKVYLDDTLLSTVKTAGKAGARLVSLGHFSAPRSGTVRIVTTTGRVVRIDGLGVSTAAF